MTGVGFHLGERCEHVLQEFFNIQSGNAILDFCVLTPVGEDFQTMSELASGKLDDQHEVARNKGRV